MPTVTTYEALLSGYSWNGLDVAGRPTFISYSFDNTWSPSFAGAYSAAFLDSFQPFSAAEQDVARRALRAWADVSGLTLLEVAPGQGDIRFGVYDFDLGPASSVNSLGFAYSPFVLALASGATEEDFGGDIFIDIGKVTLATLLHELGHALGLKHPFEGEIVLDRAIDSIAHTVMTYNSVDGPATALGLLDGLAIQHLYGTQAQDGSQAASWTWDAVALRLSQSGGAGADSLAGVAVADRIQAGAGDDYVMGRGGADELRGDDGADTLAGGDGDDVLDGAHGADVIAGGKGADAIWGGAGANYLRGDDGADNLVGGADFDDINGNVGDDSASGGDGGDWVVGGKDHDVLSGDAGDDLVYGNLGADTCDGGAGADTLRGGQQDDVLRGGAGDDFLFGDRDSDTLTGGAGADLFHTFGEAGVDRVTDFSLAQGDRVHLDPGTQFTVAQVGADTVISMAGGGQMTLVGVELSTLTPGWIVGV